MVLSPSFAATRRGAAEGDPFVTAKINYVHNCRFSPVLLSQPWSSAASAAAGDANQGRHIVSGGLSFRRAIKFVISGPNVCEWRDRSVANCFPRRRL